jgi:uncharacterized protein (DUF1778 family)
MTRDAKIVVRFTKDEKELIEEYAKSIHLPLTVLIRSLVLNKATETKS